MSISHQLRKLRKSYNMTLKQLSSKVGYGTGNLSSYETGKLKAKDKTLLRILMKGFDMLETEAKNMIAQWRTEELEKKYNLSLSQRIEDYHSDEWLESFLRNKGLDDEKIKKIKEEIKKLQKKT